MILSALGAHNKIVVFFQPTDMRCGRYRLSQIIQSYIGVSPLSGDWFLFFNKRKTSIKILFYTHGGFVVCHKVLEQGTFQLPKRETITVAELFCILEGIEISQRKKRKRYSM